ncbi:MAG: lipopolysaccharide biosynthesis protein [Solirubrobacteraceae bacterium]
MTALPSTRRSLLSGGTYALANAGQRALVFILLPVYTAVMSAAEYGRLGLLLTIQTGAAVILTGGMDNGVMRHFFQLEGDRPAQRRFILTAWRFLTWAAVGLSALVAVGLVLFAPTTAAFRPEEGALAVLVAAMFVGATVVPLTVLRAEHRLKDYIVLTSVTGIATVVLTVLFVVVLRLGVAGWLIASMLANGLTLLAGLVVVPWEPLRSADRDGLRAALKLGIPLVPHAASGWSLQLADRIVLASLVAVSSLGVYTLAANISLPAMVVLQGLNMGFLPSYARVHANPNAVRDLRNAVTLQVIMALAVGCGLALLGPPVVSLMSTSYAGAGELVPWIVLGYVFMGLYFIPMNVISMVVGRTTFVWTLTLTAAATNIGAIYWLVPRDGIAGAAEASAIGYLVLLILMSLYARTCAVRASVDWARVLPMAGVLIVTFAIGALWFPSTGAMGLATRIALYSTLPLTLMCAGRLTPRTLLGSPSSSSKEKDVKDPLPLVARTSKVAAPPRKTSPSSERGSTL